MNNENFAGIMGTVKQAEVTSGGMRIRHRKPLCSAAGMCTEKKRGRGYGNCSCKNKGK